MSFSEPTHKRKNLFLPSALKCPYINVMEKSEGLDKRNKSIKEIGK